MQGRIRQLILPLLVAVGSYLYWWQGVPQLLGYYEQNQLFLCRADYLSQALARPGGVADYLSEALMQLGLYPWAGALWMAFQCTLFFLCITRLLRRLHSCYGVTPLFFTLTLLLWACDVLWVPSYLTALTCTLLVTVWMGRRLPLADAMVVPLCYWAFGPVALLYAGFRCLTLGWRHLWTLALFAFVLCTSALCCRRWPWQVVLSGVNYRLDALQQPVLTWLLPMAILALGGWYRLCAMRRWSKWLGSVVLSLPLLFLYRPDGEALELLRLDQLVRGERWGEVIDRVERRSVEVPFTSQCVNLALGMTGQLPDRMFSFYQSGPEALFMPMVRDNMSDYPTAEAFFHLGMVQEALRYYTDLRQSILNYKGSARCTRRIVECHLVNGDYIAAERHLALLKDTWFYRSWAQEAERCLHRDDLVAHHPVWGRLRRYRYRENFLYNYEERHKMLGLLFSGCTENRLALAYFMGQLLLNGEYSLFTQHMPWVQQFGGYADMPYGYRDVFQYVRGEASSSPYGHYVERMKKLQR